MKKKVNLDLEILELEAKVAPKMEAVCTIVDENGKLIGQVSGAEC